MRYWIALLATITLILTPYLSRGMLALRRGVGHDRVMRIEGYPTDDSSIAEALKRFFPEPKNILRGLLFGALALFLALVGSEEGQVYADFWLGLAAMGVLINAGRYLAPLLTYRYMQRHPGALSGELRMSYAAGAWTSFFQLLIVIFPLLLALLFSPSAFLWGALLAPLLQALGYWRMVRAHEKKRAETAAPEEDPQAPRQSA